MAVRVELLVLDDRALRGRGAEGPLRVLAAGLTSLGLAPARAMVVGASAVEAGEAIAAAIARAEVLVVAGGLETGVVAEVLAAGAGLAAEVRVLARGGELLAPPAARLLETPEVPEVGLAVTVGRAEVYCLPESRAALEALLEARVLPALAGRRRPPRRSVRLALFGPTRAEVEARLAPLALPGGASLEVHSRFPEVEVEVLAADEGLARDAAVEVVAALGEGVVHGVRGETLAEAAASALGSVGADVAIVETSPAAALLRRLGAAAAVRVPSVLRLGLVAPTPAALCRALDLPEEDLVGRTLVAAEPVAAAAEAARRRSGAAVGLAIAGIAGPTSDGPDRPLGLVHCALASAAGVRGVERRLGPMARWRLEELAAATALSQILEWCRGRKVRP